MDKRKVLHDLVDEMPKENLWAFIAFAKELKKPFFGSFIFKCKANIIYQIEPRPIKREDD